MPAADLVVVMEAMHRDTWLSVKHHTESRDVDSITFIIIRLSEHLALVISIAPSVIILFCFRYSCHSALCGASEGKGLSGR